MHAIDRSKSAMNMSFRPLLQVKSGRSPAKGQWSPSSTCKSQDLSSFGNSNSFFKIYISYICKSRNHLCPRQPRRRNKKGSEKEKFAHATPRLGWWAKTTFYFLCMGAHVAALRYARRAQPDEFYFRSVCLGLRASLYVEPIPATLEIHAAALLCLLRCIFLSMRIKDKYALLSRNGICREYAIFGLVFTQIWLR